MSQEAAGTAAAQAIVREKHPELDPEAGPGAARRWRRLIRLTEVAQEYEEARIRGETPPAAAVAKARGVEPSTVRSWMHQARREGLVSPTEPSNSAGHNVRRNIRLLRTARRLSTSGLSDDLREAGRPIPATGITRIEGGERRVDVDDLVALAAVFGVAPALLLEPPMECGTCHGAPPPGFACKECGAGT